MTFLSSADWMTRNLDRRVEVSAPILDESLAQDIRAQFERMWSDNTHARRLLHDGTNEWIVPQNGASLVEAQHGLYLELKARQA